MSDWIKAALSAILLVLAVFLFFHAYNVWLLSHRVNRVPVFNIESEKLPVYTGLGLGGLVLGLFLLIGRGLERQLRRKVLMVVLIFLGSLLLFQAYSVWITYQDVSYMTASTVDALSYIKDIPLVAPFTSLVSWFLQDWQKGVSRPYQTLPFYIIVGAILLLIGISKATQPEKLKMRDLIKTAPSEIPIVLSMFLYFYAYYMWVGHYIGQYSMYAPYRLLPFVAADPWLFGPLDSWLLYYVWVGLVSLAVGLITTHRIFNAQMSKLPRMILLGSITVFGEFMIFYGYNILVYYLVEPKFVSPIVPYPDATAGLPLYFIAGLLSFPSGLIMIYKATKTDHSKLSNLTLSAILVVTGSLLIHDAYSISVRYNEFRYNNFIQGWSRGNAVLVGLQIAYQWLPLYITVALTSIASGLIIAYKTFKASKINSLQDTKEFLFQLTTMKV